MNTIVFRFEYETKGQLSINKAINVSILWTYMDTFWKYVHVMDTFTDNEQSKIMNKHGDYAIIVTKLQ